MKRQNIKVTYVITSFNHKKYIKNTIDSILNQTYRNIELIVCDDCSTDGSIPFLEEYSVQKGFLFYKNSCNIGASRTTQRLIELATGEYICFIASDDWIKPDKVEKQVAIMVEKQLDGVFSPIIKYFEEADHYEEQESSGIAKIVNGGKTLQHIYETGIGGGLIQSGMFKTEAVKKIGFLEGYKSDDFLFQIRFLQAGYKVGYLNEALVYYRIHSNNSHADVMYCLEELELPVIRDFIPEKYRAKREAGAYATAALKALSQYNWQQSVFLQKESLKRKLIFKNCLLFMEKDLRYILIKWKVYPLLYRMLYHKEWKK